MSLKSFLKLLIDKGATDDQIIAGIDFWRGLDDEGQPVNEPPAMPEEPDYPPPAPDTFSDRHVTTDPVDDLQPVADLAHEFGYLPGSLVQAARRHPDVLILVEDTDGKWYLSHSQVQEWVNNPRSAGQRGKRSNNRAPKSKPTQPAGRASLLEIKPWVTVESASKELGISESTILYYIERGGLAYHHFANVPGLVHERQIAYWHEHKKVLDVDETVFDRWERASIVGAEFGKGPKELYKLINDGRLTSYQPHPGIRFLNLEECRRVLLGKK